LQLYRLFEYVQLMLRQFRKTWCPPSESKLLALLAISIPARASEKLSLLLKNKLSYPGQLRCLFVQRR